MCRLLTVSFLLLACCSFAFGSDCGKVGKMEENRISREDAKVIFGKLADCGCDHFCKDDKKKEMCKKCVKSTVESKELSDECRKELPKEATPCIEMAGNGPSDEQIDAMFSSMNDFLVLFPGTFDLGKQCPCESIKAFVAHVSKLIEDNKENIEKMKEKAKKFYDMVLKSVIDEVKPCFKTLMKNKDEHMKNMQKYAKEECGATDESLKMGENCGKGMMSIMAKGKKGD